MTLIVFNPTTGSIIRSVTGDASNQAGPGEAELVYDGSADWSSHFVLNGVVTQYTDAQRAERSRVVSPGLVWSNDAMAWVDVRPLEDIQLAKWEEIKQARAAEIDAPLITPYGAFQCRAEDRQNISDTVLLAQTLASMNQPVAIDWTLANNTVVVLDLQMMVTVGLLLGQKIQAAHAKARTLRQAIEAATTVQAVEAIAWEQ